MSRTTVFACESQPIVTEGLARALSASEDFEYIGCASSPSETLAILRDLQPGILLVDHSTSLKVALQFIADVKANWPNCQSVLWIHDLAEVDCFRALQFGARGILKKTLPVQGLLDCLRAVGRGDIWIEGSAEPSANTGDRRSSPRLTPREREIVQHICGGLKNKEIAQALSITPGTVKVHLMHIFEKTGVKDRFELALYSRRLLGLERATSSSPVEIQQDKLRQDNVA